MKKLILLFFASLLLVACQSPIVNVERFEHSPSVEFYSVFDRGSYPLELRVADVLFTLDIEGVGPDKYRSWLKVFSNRDLTGNLVILDIKSSLKADSKSLIEQDSLEFSFDVESENYLSELYFLSPAPVSEQKSFIITVKYRLDGKEGNMNFLIERNSHEAIAWPT